MFLEMFKEEKPILAMLHLNGNNQKQILERAKREIEIYRKYGVDSVLVENYFGRSKDVENVLKYLQKEHSDYIYGVNILGDYENALELASEYEARYIQIDSVCGHLDSKTDIEYGKELINNKKDMCVLGGVRFKYQSVNSGRNLHEDLIIGKTRCDAVVVTGGGTGMSTDIEKIKSFREILGDFPLVVGAGLTVDSFKESLSISDAAIVGSTFKERRSVYGEVSEENIKEFMDKVFENRLLEWNSFWYE